MKHVFNLNSTVEPLESLNLFRTLIDQAGDAFFIHDFEGKILEANKQASLNLGYTKEELLKMYVTDIEVDFNLESARREWLKILPGSSYTVFGHHRRKDGSVFPVEIRFGAADWKGERLFIGLVRDITRRRANEEALRLSEEKFSKAFNFSPDAIIIISKKGEFLDGNNTFLEIAGLKKEDITGKKVVFSHVWNNPEDRVRFLSMLNEKGSVTDFEAQWNTTTRGLRDFLVAVQSFEYNNEECILGIFRDITEQKRIQKELENVSKDLEQRVKERTNELEAVNKELESFTYSVSHDLKAPLRGINGFSKLLFESFDNNREEEAKVYIDFIRANTRKMNMIIDDLLEYSRIERSQVKRSKVNIRELIDSIVSVYRGELDKFKFSLYVDVPNTELCLDIKGIMIIIRNLIENAIKFTSVKPDPVIEISVEEVASRINLIVSDNGIGFDMRYNERIFEVFQRLHSDEEFPGTGIGLAMVRKAVQKMNGRVWAESAVGKGASFFIEIPVGS